MNRVQDRSRQITFNTSIAQRAIMFVAKGKIVAKKLLTAT